MKKLFAILIRVEPQSYEPHSYELTGQPNGKYCHAFFTAHAYVHSLLIAAHALRAECRMSGLQD